MNRFLKVVLLVNPSRQYTRGLLSGIIRYVQINRRWTFYRPLLYRITKDQEQLIDFIRKVRPDGILMREPASMDRIAATGIPIVTFPYSRDHFDGMVNVISDHRAIGSTAAKYFLEKGYRNFAFVGFEDWWWARERWTGFTVTLQARGLVAQFYRTGAGKLGWSDEIPEIAAWLRKQPKRLALMTCNDDCGELVIEACKLAQLRVPEDVAVLGVDNDPLVCELCAPPLSTITLNLEAAGYAAAEMLDDLMAGRRKTPETIRILPTGVITRQSTSLYAIDDEQVAAAVSFIQRHADEALSVNDVVNSTCLSRRTLEERFRLLVGRSIHAEIRRQRITRIQQLLATTSLTITQISQRLHFDEVTHLSRYFRRETGQTPRQYRRKIGYCDSLGNVGDSPDNTKTSHQ